MGYSGIEISDWQMVPSELWQQPHDSTTWPLSNPASQKSGAGPQSASDVHLVASSVQVPMPSNSISVMQSAFGQSAWLVHCVAGSLKQVL